MCSEISAAIPLLFRTHKLYIAAIFALFEMSHNTLIYVIFLFIVCTVTKPVIRLRKRKAF